MLNTDRAPESNAALYGTHPFYMIVEDQVEPGQQPNAHGVLLFNNNPQDIVLQPTPAINYRTVGGILDFFVYLGPSPAAVVKQHTALVGRSELPPYWGLGFHLCKYGYGTLDKTKAAWQRTRDAQIPFDVQWNDIDAFDKYQDFTYDPVKFAEFPEFVNHLHSIGMHYVPIVVSFPVSLKVVQTNMTNTIRTQPLVFQTTPASDLMSKDWK